jgi:hypothetical protein
MWIIVLFLSVALYFLYKNIREPLESSPYEMVQEQAGAIQQIHDTLTKITLSEASIDALQSENDQTTDQINQLQQNIPSTAAADAYPPE